MLIYTGKTTDIYFTGHQDYIQEKQKRKHVFKTFSIITVGEWRTRSVETMHRIMEEEATIHSLSPDVTEFKCIQHRQAH